MKISLEGRGAVAWRPGSVPDAGLLFDIFQVRLIVGSFVFHGLRETDWKRYGVGRGEGTV